MKKSLIINSILIIFTAFMPLLNASCSKPSSYTFSGHIYKNCGLEPVKNLPIQLYERISGGIKVTGGQLAATTTDANGYFSFTFTPQNVEGLLLQTTAGYGYNIICGFSGANKDLTNIVIYEHPTANIQLSFNVLKPYTNMDTLGIVNLATGRDTLIAGPFKSGIFFTAMHYGVEMDYPSGLKSLNWDINWRKTGLTNFKNINITKYCTDTNKAVITIQ